jgi:hypothetical protein
MAGGLFRPELVKYVQQRVTTHRAWVSGFVACGGFSYGESDDFGFKVVKQPVSVFDFHATILHKVGLDHKRLTYYFNGRNMRLTDVSGELIPQIVGTQSAKV